MEEIKIVKCHFKYTEVGIKIKIDDGVLGKSSLAQSQVQANFSDIFMNYIKK